MDSPAETDPETPLEPTPPDRPPFRVVSLLPGDGREPPASLSETAATLAWSTVTAPWHPALLAIADALPSLEPLENPGEPAAGEVRLIPAGSLGQLSPEYRARAKIAGAAFVEASEDRLATVRALLGQAGQDRPIEDDPVARDYLALGAAVWWLRDLTIGMDHGDTVSRATLAREVLAGAASWAGGDPSAATNRLRAAFELLTQGRERFYPLDGYILDLCLLDPATPPDALGEVLEHRTPVTLVAPGRAIEVFAEREPERAESLRSAITEGWADVVGGSYAEVDEPFLPWSSLVWQFRRGAEAYRQHLDDRNVETLARRRFGLYPQLAQVARRFGLRFGMFFALDAGRFPVLVESKRLWASPDGSTIESITRLPLAADRAVEGLRLPWKLARAMKDDPAPTLLLAHWPDPVAGWYRDFRRTAAYSPVLLRWVTVNDFFHRSDRPFEEVDPKLDDYAPPYLAQAAARRDPTPISQGAERARLRGMLDGLIAAQALTSALDGTVDATADDLETSLEAGGLDLVRQELPARLQTAAEGLARRIVGEGSAGRPGYLILNLAGVARRVAVTLPDAPADLAPSGPLKAAQLTEDGVQAVVELAPFGYAWVARDGSGPPASSPFTVRDRTVTHESMVVALDPATGGIRTLHALGEETPRVGQQLVMTGFVGPDGQPATSRMRGAGFEVDYAGPALLRATTTGTLHDPLDDRRLARFRQTIELWNGRPGLELEIELSDLDPAWLAKAASSDPWSHHLACRWAWPDTQATLRRSALLAPHATLAEHAETSESFDITSRQRRTTLLFGGLAHHRRVGARMLDTILVAGSETARTFRLGVTLDLEHPFPAILDQHAPAPVVVTDAGPPRSGPVGWLVQVDHKAVALVGFRFEKNLDEDRGFGLVADLIETSGKPARCRLRAFRDPTSARQVDGRGEHVVDLPTDGDAALVDLTPHEIARVELNLP